MLSRMHEDEEGELMVIIVVQPKWLQEIKDKYVGDQQCMELIKELERDPKSKPHFTFINGVVRYKSRLYVGKVEEVRNNIMEVIHASSEGGHTGFIGTYHKAKAHFYWLGMKAEIRNGLQVVMCVKGIKGKMLNQLGYCSHSLYQNRRGNILAWISLMGCPNPK